MNGVAAQSVLEFATRLITSKERDAVIRSFCQGQKLDALMIFIPDAESGAHLAAPGFPQTLPGGIRWKNFVIDCLVRGSCTGSLPLANRTERPAQGVAAHGYVIILLGDTVPAETLSSLLSILPILGAALGFERATLAKAAHAAIAENSAREAHALTIGLDEARRSAQREVAARIRAEADLRQHMNYLEILNRTGSALAAELVSSKIIQTVTDAGKAISGSDYGGFCSNESDPNLRILGYRTPGTSSEIFEILCDFGWAALQANNSPPGGITRLNDGPKCEQSGRGKTALSKDCAQSYLFVPIRLRTGQTVGGLVFGHHEPRTFTAEIERIMEGIAAQTAISLDNAILYEALQKELADHQRAEVALIQAKDELTRTNNELDMRVHERTASLQAAVEQMEEFSYTVSHDLRAPLRGMHAYSSALLEDFADILPAEARRYIERIKDNSQRLDRMSLDVLTFSKVARTEIQVQPMDLNKLVAEILATYPGMRSTQAEITVAHLHPMVGHEPSMVQALSNLLANALKFVRPGHKPMIRIWTERLGIWARLWVEDNGIGIDPKYHHRLFNMFERVHPTLNYEGTGVGLAIVRKAVNRMGGSCGVESDGQHGSRFWIKLKLPERLDE